MRYLSSYILSAIAITSSVVAFTPSSQSSIIVQHRSSSSSSSSSILYSTPTTTEYTGTVKWYNAERGFGFIEIDNGGQDMYVHATGLTTAGPLLEDERVSFITEIDARTNKPKAVNVVRTDTPADGVVEEPPKEESVVEKVMKVVKTELSEDEKKQKSIKAEKFQRARLAVQLAQPKPVAATPTTASVDYDATVRLAYDAAGSSDDFDVFKEQYLSDTSAMVGKKYQDAIAADLAAAKAAEEKKAAEAKAAEEAAAAAKAEEAKAAAEAEAKAVAEAKAAEEARLAAEAKAAELAKALEEARLAAEAKAAEEARLAAEEEAKRPEVLAAKYAAMDLEERAFTILCDLGMIELHPDPDDPNRDRSKDDEDI